jgi:hypothetical protein
MNLLPFRVLLAAGLNIALGTFSATAKDALAVDLDPASWSLAADTEANKDGDVLHITGTTTSIWASPAGRWPVSQNLALRLQGAADGGNLIAQAEWFDRAGQLVAAEEVLRLSGSTMETRDAPMQPPDGAADFALKFWIEGEPAKASIAGITVERQPDWPSNVHELHRVEPGNTKVEADSGLIHSADAASWIFSLAEGTPYASVHLDSPVEARPGLRVLLPVLALPPNSSVSMQILRWGGDGNFLGDTEALKDLTEVGDYEFVIPDAVTEADPKPAKLTTKIWVTAPVGQAVRLGAPVYAEADTAP